MGRRSERRKAQWAQTAATAGITAREAEARRTEEMLATQERLLGTEAQVRGELGVSEAEVPYLGRYQAAPTLSGLTGKGLTGAYQAIERSIGEANRLMSAAQAAAAGGDLAQAESLRQQAANIAFEGVPGLEGAKTGFWSDPALLKRLGSYAPGWEKAITFGAPPELGARAQLASPMAQTVGEIVRQGREFLDPESPTSREFYGRLTEPALEAFELGREQAVRTLGAGEREAARAARDISAARPGGRAPLAEAAVAGRVSERFATERVGVETRTAAAQAAFLGDTARYFEEFRANWAATAPQLAQAWLHNQAGVREAYQQRLDRLTQMAVDQAMNRASMHLQFAQLSQQAADTSRAMTMSAIGMGVGAAISLIAAIPTGGLSLLALPGMAGLSQSFAGLTGYTMAGVSTASPAFTGATALSEAAAPTFPWAAAGGGG